MKTLQEYIENSTDSLLKEVAQNIALDLEAFPNMNSIHVLDNSDRLDSLEPGYYLRFLRLNSFGQFHLYGTEVNNMRELLVHENISKALFTNHADAAFKNQLLDLDRSGKVVFHTAKTREGGLDLHTDLVREYLEKGKVGATYDSPFEVSRKKPASHPEPQKNLTMADFQAAMRALTQSASTPPPADEKQLPSEKKLDQ